MPRFRPHKMYPGALLAQECCSYQATTQLLMRMRGELAVIIHSDRDCSNVLPKTGREIRQDGAYKFFCTNMREDELVTGQGNAKLRRSIELVHEAYKPKLILVLTTCPTVMIGDNVKNVVRKTGRDIGANVVSEVTHGLRPKSPAEVVDQCYSTLARGATPTVGDVEKRINLVGINLRPAERAEIESVVSAMGLTVNAVLNEDSSLDDFLAVAQARYNVHPGPNFMIEFDAQTAEKFGLKPVEVPMPFGIRATDRFYRAIATATGVDDATLAAALAPLRREAAAAIDEYRPKLTEAIGRTRNRAPRCAFNIGSVRSFDLRIIAHEEMGELPFFEELGFDCKLFIQGPADEANQKRTAAVLAELAVGRPFVIFPDPGGLAKVLSPGEFDLFFGIDFLRDQLTKVNLPLMEKPVLCLGYGAVRDNVRALNEVITTPFYRHFRPEPSAKVAMPVVQDCRV